MKIMEEQNLNSEISNQFVYVSYHFVSSCWIGNESSNESFFLLVYRVVAAAWIFDCNIVHTTIQHPVILTNNDNRYNSLLTDYFELEMEFDDAETCSALFLCLESLVLEAKNITTEKGELNVGTKDSEKFIYLLYSSYP